MRNLVAEAKAQYKELIIKAVNEAIAAGEKIEPGRWYMMDPLMDFQHASYMGTVGWPVSVEDFYVNYINTVKITFNLNLNFKFNYQVTKG